MKTYMRAESLSQALRSTIINAVLTEIDSLKTVSHQYINLSKTYPEFLLILNSLRERIYNLEAEPVLADVEVLEAFVATEIREQSA